MILNPKYIPRLAAIVGLFTSYGLRDIASQHGLLALAPADDPGPDGEGADRTVLAGRLRDKLVELGPAYVKLGQLLSTRPDLLPPEYICALESLQDNVGAIPYAEVEEVVEAELGGRISKLFDFFDPEPLGTASLGQVHGARLRGGRAVVVKVQRPHVRTQLAEDVEFFKELSRFLAEHTSAGKRVDIVGVIQELERALADELDYRIEARNSALIRRAFAQFPRLIVPRVIEAYSTSRVLTTERLRGVKVDAIPPVARLDYDFGALAEEVTRAYLKGITVDGFFHADPHPGNIFVIMPDTLNPRTPSEIREDNWRAEERTVTTPLAKLELEAQREAAPVPHDADVKLAMIDFGMTARLSSNMRDSATRLLMAVGDMRGDEVAATMVELGSATADFDRGGFSAEIGTIVMRNADLSAGEAQAGRILFDVIDVAYRFGLRLPADLTLLAKALFNLDGVARALDPAFTPFETIRAYSNELAMERARKDLSPRRMYQALVEGSNLLNVLPHRLDQITARLANNEMSTHVDVPQLPALIVALQKVANRIFSGLVLAGLLVASAMLLPYWQRLGMVGFVIAAVLALYIVGTIIASDRGSRTS